MTLAWQETPATDQNTGAQETPTGQDQKEKHNAGAKGEGHHNKPPTRRATPTGHKRSEGGETRATAQGSHQQPPPPAQATYEENSHLGKPKDPVHQRTRHHETKTKNRERASGKRS